MTKDTRSAYRNSNHLPQAYPRTPPRTAWPLVVLSTATPEIDDAQPQVDHAQGSSAHCCKPSCPKDGHGDDGSGHGKYAYCLKSKGHRMLFYIVAGGTKDLGAFGFYTLRFNLKQVRV